MVVAYQNARTFFKVPADQYTYRYHIVRKLLKMSQLNFGIFNELLSTQNVASLGRHVE